MPSRRPSPLPVLLLTVAGLACASGPADATAGTSGAAEGTGTSVGPTSEGEASTAVSTDASAGATTSTTTDGTAADESSSGGATGLTDIHLLALHQDFESTGLELGQILTTNGIMDGTAGVLDDGEVYSGSRSAKIHAVADSENTWQFGWYYDLEAYLGFQPVEGDEIWIRFRSFMPHGGSYASSTGLKWLRVSTESSAGENLGAVYSLLDPSGAWLGIYEGGGLPYLPYYDGTDRAPQPGVWETYELYVGLDDVPLAEGGAAAWRLWKDGALLGEIDTRASFVSATDRAFSIAWCTYWNGGGGGGYPTVDQDWWVDDIAVAVNVAGWRDDRPHLASDDQGRLYIGM